MKKLIGFIIVSIFLVACATIGIAPTECTLYEQYGATPENSLIASKISDPCAANRIITLVAKLGVIQWEKEYIEEFNKWSDEAKLFIADGITYKAVQDMIIVKVAQLNMKAGLTLFILSDGILVFDTNQVIMDKDIELLTALIDNLKREVNSLGIML